MRSVASWWLGLLVLATLTLAGPSLAQEAPGPATPTGQEGQATDPAAGGRPSGVLVDPHQPPVEPPPAPNGGIAPSYPPLGEGLYQEIEATQPPSAAAGMVALLAVSLLILAFFGVSVSRRAEG